MALYRKYRPATFAEVVGQEHVTDPLSTALDTGRISHAYLFSGPRGCGKTSSARILARSLNCVEGPTSRPCGVCASCVALAPGGPGNLDVIELDAASHGGVDDTRELRDRAFYAPAESRYRVFIVDEAHMVTTAGFNALLKIVEEPPAHLIFVFATTEPDKVLPTIRSRTHHYPFRLLPPATMRGLLGGICEQEGVQVEEAVYPLVIRAGGGSPRDSLSVLDQLLAGAGPEGVTYPRALALLGVTDIALIDDAVEALATDDGAALFGTIDRVVEAGHDPRRFATDLLERVRDLILLRAVPDAAERNLVTGPGDVLDRMRDQAQRIGPATLARYAELLHEGLGEMRGATAPRLLLEVVCARMLLPSVSDAESATLQRLERVERHLSGTPVPPPATTPSAPPAQTSTPPSGEPRRRGAEALAAIRETRSGKPTSPQPPQAPPTAAHSTATPQATQAPQSTTAPQSAQAPHATASQPIATPQEPQAPQSAAPQATEIPQPTVAPQPVSAPQPAAPQAAQASRSPAAPQGAQAPESDASQAVSASEPVAASQAVQAPQSTPASQPVSAPQPAASQAARASRSSAAPQGARAPESDASQAVSASERVAASQAVQAPQAAASQAAEAPQSTVAPQAVSAPQAARATESSAASQETQAPQSPVSQAIPDSEQVAASRATQAAQSSAASQAAAAPQGGSAPQSGSAAQSDVAESADAALQSGVVPQVDSASQLDGASEAGAGRADSAAQVGAGSQGDVASAGQRAGGAVRAGSGSEADGAAAGVAAQVGPGSDAVGGSVRDAGVAEGVVPQVGGSEGELLREVEGRWGEIRAKVREFGAAVHALLSGAAVARVDGDVIVFAHQHAPLAQRLSNPKYVEAVEAAVHAVLGRRHGVRWEVGAAAAPARNQAAAPARESGRAPARGGQSGRSEQSQPRFTRPSQARAASPDASQARGREGASTEEDSATRFAPPDDDIPLPDGPDYPDDPGPTDYSPVGYDGVPPASTEEEEREMLAESARPVPPGDRRDPDEVALELLRTELGATRLDG
ncbi:DNA polymerase III subunit gamma and tau [Nocardia terpenica]|uniref:DNA polymerase III subunit gamma and tau n=1 Tax=Nocardia terpenica TaxID=455432 RepID=UPI0039812A48